MEYNVSLDRSQTKSARVSESTNRLRAKMDVVGQALAILTAAEIIVGFCMSRAHPPLTPYMQLAAMSGVGLLCVLLAVETLFRRLKWLPPEKKEPSPNFFDIEKHIAAEAAAFMASGRVDKPASHDKITRVAAQPSGELPPRCDKSGKRGTWSVGR